VDDDSPDVQKRPRKPTIVRCPICGFDKAVIIFVQHKQLTGFCPKCEQIWDDDDTD
jgi:transcription elongation factor Elf1